VASGRAGIAIANDNRCAAPTASAPFDEQRAAKLVLSPSMLHSQPAGGATDTFADGASPLSITTGRHARSGPALRMVAENASVRP
jgi:hypothetical protein